MNYYVNKGLRFRSPNCIFIFFRIVFYNIDNLVNTYINNRMNKQIVIVAGILSRLKVVLYINRLEDVVPKLV